MNAPEVEPLATIAEEFARATEEIRRAAQPFLDAGVALLKRMDAGSER